MATISPVVAGVAGKVIMSGRVITPSTLLRVDSNCASAETNLNLVSLSRTLTVSPGATPTDSGTKLLNAMASITPTQASPWLIRLEPGVYDLGSSYLALKPYINVEGSGELLTIISSSVEAANPPVSGTVVMTTSTEIRFVTVTNSSNSPAVYVPDGATNVQIFRTGLTGGNNGYGLFSNASSGVVSVTNSTLTGGNDGYGFYNDSSGAVTVTTSTITGGNIGLYNSFNGSVKVGASQLSGNFAPVNGTAQCAASYDGSTMMVLSSSCG